MPVAQTGSRRMMALSSSTWVTVQSFHGSGEPFIWSDCISTAALSKKLEIITLEVLMQIMLIQENKR